MVVPSADPTPEVARDKLDRLNEIAAHIGQSAAERAAGTNGIPAGRAKFDCARPLPYWNSGGNTPTDDKRASQSIILSIYRLASMGEWIVTHQQGFGSASGFVPFGCCLVHEG